MKAAEVDGLALRPVSQGLAAPTPTHGILSVCHVAQP